VKGNVLSVKPSMPHSSLLQHYVIQMKIREKVCVTVANKIYCS